MKEDVPYIFIVVLAYKEELGIEESVLSWHKFFNYR